MKLLANPRTRRIHLAHILRRFLGGMKFHQVKIATQIYGGMLFLRQNRRHLREAMPEWSRACDEAAED